MQTASVVVTELTLSCVVRQVYVIVCDIISNIVSIGNVVSDVIVDDVRHVNKHSVRQHGVKIADRALTLPRLKVIKQKFIKRDKQASLQASCCDRQLAKHVMEFDG